jgi:hypothetical protein
MALRAVRKREGRRERGDQTACRELSYAKHDKKMDGKKMEERRGMKVLLIFLPPMFLS